MLAEAVRSVKTFEHIYFLVKKGEVWYFQNLVFSVGVSVSYFKNNVLVHCFS